MKLETLNNKVQSDVVVCMTSWPKRIENAASVINDIWNGVAVPSKVVLTLCKSEFPYNNIPNDLAYMLKEGLVEINWVNENIKSFKRFIPYLATHTHDPEMTIVTVDDDHKYSKMFLYRMLVDSMLYQDSVISADIYPTGWASLFKPRFFMDKYLWCGLTKNMCEYVVNSDMWVWANLQGNKVQVFTDRSLCSECCVNDDRWALSCECNGQQLLNVRSYLSDLFRQRGIFIDLRFAHERK